MEVYLFDWQIIITWQLFYGIAVGVISTYFITKLSTPEIHKARRAKLIAALKKIKRIQNQKNNLIEQIMWFKRRYANAIDELDQYKKDNEMTDEAIMDLSKKKNELLTENKKLLAEKNHWYIECDKARAEIVRLTSPSYAKSNTIVKPGGEIV